MKENQLFGSLAFLEHDNSVLPRRIRGDGLLVVKKRVDDYLCSKFQSPIVMFLTANINLGRTPIKNLSICCPHIPDTVCLNDVV